MHITGNKTIHPFTNDEENIICVFNGEIYNYKKFEDLFKKKYNSDGECLIDLYNNYGETFTKYILKQILSMLSVIIRKLEIIVLWIPRKNPINT